MNTSTLNEAISDYITYIDSLPKKLLEMPLTEFQTKYDSNLQTALEVINAQNEDKV